MRAAQRNHGSNLYRWQLGALDDLLRFARDDKLDADLRATALELVADDPHYFASLPSVRAVLRLIHDPSPTVRAAAVATAARAFDWAGGDTKDQTHLGQIKTEVRQSLTEQFVAESSNETLFALAESFDRAALPPRKGGPLAAVRARLIDGMLRIDVRCLRASTKLRDSRLVSTAADAGTDAVPTYSVSQWCAQNTGTGPLGVDATSFPPGHRPLSVELKLDGASMSLPIGELFVDEHGLLSLRP